jgi:hypothetical protein
MRPFEHVSPEYPDWARGCAALPYTEHCEDTAVLRMYNLEINCAKNISVDQIC